MKSAALRTLGLIMLAGGAIAAASRESAKADAATYQKSVQPLLAKYCLTCHNSKLKIGNLNLEAYKDAPAALKDPDVWENVMQKLHAGVMPPPGLPRPKAEDVEVVDRWIKGLLEQADRRTPDPGRVTARRLNRFEYNNTIHDLLDLDFRAADDFPARRLRLRLRQHRRRALALAGADGEVSHRRRARSRAWPCDLEPFDLRVT
jgi:uncharacterized protein DUF1587/cytochrome c